MILPFAFFFDLVFGSEAAEVLAFFDCGSLLGSSETKSRCNYYCLITHPVHWYLVGI